MDKTGILLSAFLLSVFIAETQTASCCLSYTRQRVRCSQLKGYTIQTITGRCDLNAVIFRTWRDKLICANPTVRWTQENVRCLMAKVESMKQVSI